MQYVMTTSSWIRKCNPMQRQHVLF